MDELEKRLQLVSKPLPLCFCLHPKKNSVKVNKVFCLSFSLSHKFSTQTKKHWGEKNNGTSLWPLSTWQLSHRN